jgi:hypothetical protein
MAGIFDPLALSGIAERLAGARACPKRSSCGHARESEGEGPSADPGEEVTLIVSSEVIGFYFCD